MPAAVDAVAPSALRPAPDPFGADPGSEPDTVVLVHGLWLTPRSWEGWIERYESRGLRVVAPRWPGEAATVEAVRADPSGMAGVGIREIVDHHAAAIAALDRPPILVGHSFGGLFVQLLLDRGLGAAGVAISPAGFKGVLVLPPAQLRAVLPVLRNPRNRGRTVGLSFAQFRRGFANALDEPAARAVYERHHVPGPGRPLFQAAAANLVPNPPSRLDLRRADRAPLLLVANALDRTVPASTVRESHRRWRRSPAVTELREYEGRGHATVFEPGWEDVADDVLAWALVNA